MSPGSGETGGNRQYRPVFVVICRLPRGMAIAQPWVSRELCYMSFKPAVLGLLAAACVTAAAGGAFLAVRQNTTDRSVMALGAPEHAAPAAATPSAPQPVTETEGVVTPPPAAGAAASKPAEAPEVSPAPEKSPRHDATRTAAARPAAKDPTSASRRNTPAPVASNHQPESTTASSGPAASVGPGSSSAKDNGVRTPTSVEPSAPEPTRLPDLAPVRTGASLRRGCRAGVRGHRPAGRPLAVERDRASRGSRRSARDARRHGRWPTPRFPPARACLDRSCSSIAAAR